MNPPLNTIHQIYPQLHPTKVSQQKNPPSLQPSKNRWKPWNQQTKERKRLKGMIEGGAKQGLKESFDQFAGLLGQRVKPVNQLIVLDKDQTLEALLNDHQSHWELGVGYFCNFTVFSTVFMVVYAFVHIFLYPFVVLPCNGKTRTSSVKLQTLDPQCNEIIKFDAAEEPPSLLDVEVFDFDGPFGQPASLGNAEIRLLRHTSEELFPFFCVFSFCKQLSLLVVAIAAFCCCLLFIVVVPVIRSSIVCSMYYDTQEALRFSRITRSISCSLWCSKWCFCPSYATWQPSRTTSCWLQNKWQPPAAVTTHQHALITLDIKQHPFNLAYSMLQQPPHLLPTFGHHHQYLLPSQQPYASPPP
ncbi:unnamed protein product [Lactuca virosa]|uniref:C2 domain-containing protein n=1 Tax=Lactuca virosa TaxID=75947 RepID=A0AAU9P901_9ASTR|nr:unnamed protein product [Lactuca virosa]